MSKTALKKAAVKKCRDDKVENLRRCQGKCRNKANTHERKTLRKMKVNYALK